MSPARMSVKLSPDARGLIQTCKNNGRAGVPGLLAKIVYRKVYPVSMCGLVLGNCEELELAEKNKVVNATTKGS